MLSSAFKRSRLFDPESLGSWQRDSVREVDIVTGCLLLARRSLWDRLRGFDERFFMYGEDADLALRVADLGLRNVITPDAVVTHEIGVSSKSRPDKLVLLLAGKTTLLRKHWRGLRRTIGIRLLWAGVAVRAAAGAVAGTGPGREASAWREVWRERTTWLRGYEPPQQDPRLETSPAPR
jgi:GT2 family glycosyltransferase